MSIAEGGSGPDQDDPFAPSGSAEPRRSAPGAGIAVLFVDDEPILAEFAGEALQLAGYRVTALCDPAAALRKLAEHPRAFDVLVTDYLMPGLTGLELAEQALALCADLKVVLATGYVMAEMEREAQRLGIRAVLQKPFMPDELFATLARVVAAD